MLGQYHKRHRKADKLPIFTDDVVQMDQDDAQPESSSDYERRPPRNNNFIDRPFTYN